jgi:P27 family predicted phage terminase small subunit
MKNSPAPKPKLPGPPRHLSREAKRWWGRVVQVWVLDDAALLILESALEAFDRMREAQELLKAEGLVVKDRFGQQKAHPAAAVERDAKATMLRHLKALALDLEPLGDRPGRPAKSPVPNTR